MTNRSIIPDSSINASSSQGNPGASNKRPEYARLGGDEYWISDENDRNRWIQVDLGNTRIVTGLKTEGNDEGGTSKYWVQQLRVQVGMSEDSLEFIKDGRGQPKVCWFFEMI